MPWYGTAMSDDKKPYYGPEALAKFQEELWAVERRYNKLLLKFTHQRFANDEAREFAQHGFMRRLGTLRRCIENVFAIIPPETDKVPDRPIVRQALTPQSWCSSTRPVPTPRWSASTDDAEGASGSSARPRGGNVAAGVGRHRFAPFFSGRRALNIASASAELNAADIHLPESRFNRRDIPAGFLVVGLGRRFRSVSSLIALTLVQDVPRAAGVIRV
jgi:hypothetical protein